jgi:hypothetical protein
VRAERIRHFRDRDQVDANPDRHALRIDENEPVVQPQKED